MQVVFKFFRQTFPCLPPPFPSSLSLSVEICTFCRCLPPPTKYFLAASSPKLKKRWEKSGLGQAKERAGQALGGKRKQRLGLTGAGRAQTEAVSPDYHLPRIEYSAIRSIDMKWQINHVLSITINCQLDMISLFSFSSKLHLRNEAIPQPQNTPQIVPLCFAITQLEVCSISLSV